MRRGSRDQRGPKRDAAGMAYIYMHKVPASLELSRGRYKMQPRSRRSHMRGGLPRNIRSFARKEGIALAVLQVSVYTRTGKDYKLTALLYTNLTRALRCTITLRTPGPTYNTYMT